VTTAHGHAVHEDHGHCVLQDGEGERTEEEQGCEEHPSDYIAVMQEVPQLRHNGP
jgi:hypothetical protein